MLKQESLAPLNFHTWPYFAEDEVRKVSQILQSGKVNYWTGDEGRQFENEFAQLAGVKHGVAVMNGTVALEAALAAIDIGPGDEVITACRTFMASASAIVMRGAVPVLADVDLVSQNITAASILKVLTEKTKAIIVVHIAGWTCEMNDIINVARQYHLKIIEDCAQAVGGSYHGRPVGSLGDIGAFSFCQDKIITTGGEGGMVVTNDTMLWEKIWAYKDHGKNYKTVYHKQHPLGFRWLHESFGTNWRMTEVQAAIGRLQLTKLNDWHEKRNYFAKCLIHGFQHLDGLRLTIPPKSIKHAYYKFYVFICEEKLKKNWTRDKIIEAINQRGVPCFSGICGEIYLEKAFIEKGIGPKKRLLNAKLLSETSLMFLVHPTLTDEHMQLTMDVVNDVMISATIN